MIDAAKCICFDFSGRINLTQTDEAIKQHLNNHTPAVIPGFYGTNPKGEIITFSRNGSDVTRALIARGIAAANSGQPERGFRN